jgi:hypothetical protein
VSAKAVSITTLGLMTLSITKKGDLQDKKNQHSNSYCVTTLSVKTFSIMTPSMTIENAALSINALDTVR